MQLRKGIPAEQQVIGIASEQFFLNTMNLFIGISPQCPPWITGIEQTVTGKKDDLEEIDFKVKTLDVGEIFVQVKSSNREAKKFIEWHARGKRKFVIIVINTREDHSAIFLKTRKALSKMRQIIAKRSPEKFILAD